MHKQSPLSKTSIPNFKLAYSPSSSKNMAKAYTHLIMK